MRKSTGAEFARTSRSRPGCEAMKRPIRGSSHRAANDGTTLTVTGVMADVPPHSHLRFSALASLPTLFPGGVLDPDAAAAIQGNLYLRLSSPGAVPAVQHQLDALLKQFGSAAR